MLKRNRFVPVNELEWDFGEKKIPKCEDDCENNGSSMCKNEGNIIHGYEEFGCLVCPVFVGNKEGIVKGLRY